MRFDLPPKNIDQWVMPLDSFQVTGVTLDSYAEQLLVEPCMANAGYDWKVPYRDPKARSPMISALGIWNFNEKVASTYGYHYSIEPPLSDSREWIAFQAMTRNIPDSEFGTLRECQDAARKVLPTSDDPVNYIMNLAGSADDVAHNTTAVKAAAERWHKCMLPQGIADLPLDPGGMPTKSQSLLFGLDDEMNGGTWHISAGEIQAARADFACRESSGWREALYNAEWTAQVDVMNKYGDDVARMGKRIDAINRKIAEVIAQNAPATD